MSFNIYTYDDIEQYFKSLLDSTINWKNLQDTQVVAIISKLVARFGQLLSNEQLAIIRDFYPSTSMSDSAIMKWARFINYAFQYSNAPVGKIKIILDEIPSNPVYIGEDFTAESKDQIKISLTSDYYINPPNKEIIIDVYQGEWKTIEIIPDGNSNFKININDLGLDIVLFYLYVDGELWGQAENNVFSYSTAESKSYIIRVLSDGMRIIFGNGIYGKIPQVTEIISIKYLSTNGSVGEILALGSDILNSNYDLKDGVESVDYSVEVNTPIAGGFDREKITSVSRNIPRYINTSAGIVGISEYINKLRLYNTIIDANAWAAKLQEPYSAYTMNLIYLCAVPVSGDFLSITEKENIKDDIYKIHPMPNRLDFFDPEYIEVIIDIVAKSNNTITNENLKSAIETKCVNLMNFEYRVNTLKETIFGFIYHWRFIKEIAKIEGLDVNEGISGDLHVDLKVKDDLFTIVGGQYNYNIATQMKNLINETFYLYDKDFNLLGQDDGAGSITGSTIDSGNIDYVTGIGSVVFNVIPSEKVIGVYQLIEGKENLVSQETYQVFKLFRVDCVIEN